MTETERIAIADGEGTGKVASVVESDDVPGVYGIVLVDENGDPI